MLWCKRALILICVAALPMGCGFEPVYKQHSAQAEDTTLQAKLAAIEVLPMPGRMGQELRNTVIDLLNPRALSVAPLYRLDIKLEKKSAPADIEKDRRITRYNITNIANYTLTRIDNSKVIDKGTVKLIGSYDSLDSRFSTFVAEDFTTNNVIGEVAEEIHGRMVTTLKKKGE